MDFGTKKSLPFVFFVLTGIWALLLLGWSFTGVTSGYGIITLWNSIWSIFASLFQIMVLITIVLMLIVGIWGWIASVGKAKELKVGSWSMKAIGEFLFSIFTGLVIFVFIFLTIGGGVTFGSILYLLVILAAFITYLVLRGKDYIDKEGLFACVKISKNTTNSASKKKGSIEIKIEEPEIQPAKAEQKDKEEKKEKDKDKDKDKKEQKNKDKEEKKNKPKK